MPTKPLITFDNTAKAFAHKSDKDLKKAQFLFSSINNKTLTDIGTSLVKIALKLKLPINPILRNTIFAHFCGGESLDTVQPTINKLAEFNIETILDFAVEGAENEDAFDQSRDQELEIIKKSATSPHISFCVFKVTSLARFALLQKIQEKKELTSSEENELKRVKERILTICQASFDAKIRVMIDAEETWIQDVIDEFAYEMMERFNKEKPVVYNTFQMYRKDGLANLKKAFLRAATYQYHLGVKLVRGAYMEKERDRAKDLKYPDPIQPNREATDEDYNNGLLYCINKKQRIALCAGSHNEYSNYYLTVLMNKHGMETSDKRVYFSQLYGMSDNISFNLADAGFNVAKYVPYGPLKTVLPYLFRRAEENTAVAGQSSRELNLIRKEIARRVNEK